MTNSIINHMNGVHALPLKQYEEHFAGKLNTIFSQVSSDEAMPMSIQEATARTNKLWGYGHKYRNFCPCLSLLYGNGIPFNLKYPEETFEAWICRGFIFTRGSQLFSRGFSGGKIVSEIKSEVEQTPFFAGVYVTFVYLWQFFEDLPFRPEGFKFQS